VIQKTTEPDGLHQKTTIIIIRELAENNTASFTVAEKESVEAVISSYSP